MSKILIIEPDRQLAEAVAEHIYAYLEIDSEIVESLEAAGQNFADNRDNYMAVIINLVLSPDNYAPFENIPIIAVTGCLPTSARKMAFAGNVLDYVQDYSGYNLEYIVTLLRRGLLFESSKILIAEDEPTLLALMRNLLSNKGYSVITAKNDKQALDLIENDPDIHLMLVDGDICEKSGFTLIRSIRKEYKKNQLAIIPLCGRANDYQRVTLLRNGANDCIDKPFKIEEFHVRVMNNLQLVEVLRELTENSNRDFLTRLYNRRYFYEIGGKLYESSRRGTMQISLAMLDIDHLKTINDTHGHFTGDKAIKAVAEVLTCNLRASDVIARLGGEEFCVLCTDVKTGEAEKIFERIRQKVAEQEIAREEGSLHFTISVGVTSRINVSLEAMMHAADMLLYQSKQNGRDRVSSD
ncbi:MAG: diguanylate cyclase [Desulfosalsimonadaceae bacterium]